MQSFSSKQLFFKPLCESDKNLIVALYTNETAMRFVGSVLSEPKAINIHKDFVKKNNRKDSTFKTWAIYLRQPNNNCNISQAIGFVVLYSSIDKQQLMPAEIGIMLLPKQSGKGIATKALTSFINYLFLQLHLPVIALRFYPQNTAMRAISAKLGFCQSSANFINNKQSSANNMQVVSLSAYQWLGQ